MKNEKNILKDKAELKSMPFAVPDGYFEGLKAELKMIPKQQAKPAKVVRWRPSIRFVSIAAVVAVLIAAGAFFLGRHGEESDFTVTQEGAGYYADLQALTEDEIIEYLISTGVELDDIEQY